MHPYPTRVAFGWSRDGRSPLSVAIRYFSRPGWAPRPLAPWSHMFLVFGWDDGRVGIHEALGSQGWCSKPVTKLYKWRAQGPQTRFFEIHWLPLYPAAVERIWTESKSWLGVRSYSWRQIGAFALAKSLLGRALGLSVRSGPDEVICSEGACRIVGEIAVYWDLRETTDQSWDSVSPADAYEAYLRKVRAVAEYEPEPCGVGA